MFQIPFLPAVMGRPSPLQAGVFTALLLLLAATTTQVDAAPVQETSLSRFTNQKGCYYMNELYSSGEKIETKEPCLNCTCVESTLMCYLRVCPFVKPVGENCVSEMHVGDCCPKFWCPEVYPRITTEKPDSEPRGCYLDGRYYDEGARIPMDPVKPCEVCYCIRNTSVCTMQECELKVDGCFPQYKAGSCCPARYNCTDEAATTIPPGIMEPEDYEGCRVGDKMYHDGDPVPSENKCETCFCMKHSVACAVQKCSVPAEGCVGEAEPGQCCPTKYECPSTTEVPVWHSTLAPVSEDSTSNVSLTTDFEEEDTLGIFSRKRVSQPDAETSTVVSSTLRPVDTTDEESLVKITSEPEVSQTSIFTESPKITDATETITLSETAEASEVTKEQTGASEISDTSMITESTKITDATEVIKTTKTSATSEVTEESEVTAEDKETSKFTEESEVSTTTGSPISDSKTVEQNVTITTADIASRSREPKITEVPDVFFTLSTTRPVFFPSQTIPGEGTCRHENKTYKPMEKVSSLDPCRHNCMCVNSVWQCEHFLECVVAPRKNCKRVPPAEGECCPTYVCEGRTTSATTTVEEVKETTAESESVSDVGFTAIGVQEEVSLGEEDFTKPTAESSQEPITSEKATFTEIGEKSKEVTTGDLFTTEASKITSDEEKEISTQTFVEKAVSSFASTTEATSTEEPEKIQPETTSKEETSTDLEVKISTSTQTLVEEAVSSFASTTEAPSTEEPEKIQPETTSEEETSTDLEVKISDNETDKKAVTEISTEFVTEKSTLPTSETTFVKKETSETLEHSLSTKESTISTEEPSTSSVTEVKLVTEAATSVSTEEVTTSAATELKITTELVPPTSTEEVVTSHEATSTPSATDIKLTTESVSSIFTEEITVLPEVTSTSNVTDFKLTTESEPSEITESKSIDKVTEKIDTDKTISPIDETKFTDDETLMATKLELKTTTSRPSISIEETDTTMAPKTSVAVSVKEESLPTLQEESTELKHSPQSTTAEGDLVKTSEFVSPSVTTMMKEFVTEASSTTLKPISETSTMQLTRENVTTQIPEEKIAATTERESISFETTETDTILKISKPSIGIDAEKISTLDSETTVMTTKVSTPEKEETTPSTMVEDKTEEISSVPKVDISEITTPTLSTLSKASGAETVDKTFETSTHFLSTESTKTTEHSLELETMRVSDISITTEKVKLPEETDTSTQSSIVTSTKMSIDEEVKEISDRITEAIATSVEILETTSPSITDGSQPTLKTQHESEASSPSSTLASETTTDFSTHPSRIEETTASLAELTTTQKPVTSTEPIIHVTEKSTSRTADLTTPTVFVHAATSEIKFSEEKDKFTTKSETVSDAQVDSQKSTATVSSGEITTDAVKTVTPDVKLTTPEEDFTVVIVTDTSPKREFEIASLNRTEVGQTDLIPETKVTEASGAEISSTEPAQTEMITSSKAIETDLPEEHATPIILHTTTEKPISTEKDLVDEKTTDLSSSKTTTKTEETPVTISITTIPDESTIVEKTTTSTSETLITEHKELADVSSTTEDIPLTTQSTREKETTLTPLHKTSSSIEDKEHTEGVKDASDIDSILPRIPFSTSGPEVEKDLTTKDIITEIQDSELTTKPELITESSILLRSTFDKTTVTEFVKSTPTISSFTTIVPDKVEEISTTHEKSTTVTELASTTTVSEEFFDDEFNETKVDLPSTEESKIPETLKARTTTSPDLSAETSKAITDLVKETTPTDTSKLPVETTTTFVTKSDDEQPHTPEIESTVISKETIVIDVTTDSVPDPKTAVESSSMKPVTDKVSEIVSTEHTPVTIAEKPKLEENITDDSVISKTTTGLEDESSTAHVSMVGEEIVKEDSTSSVEIAEAESTETPFIETTQFVVTSTTPEEISEVMSHKETFGTVTTDKLESSVTELTSEPSSFDSSQTSKLSTEVEQTLKEETFTPEELKSTLKPVTKFSGETESTVSEDMVSSTLKTTTIESEEKMIETKEHEKAAVTSLGDVSTMKTTDTSLTESISLDRSTPEATSIFSTSVTEPSTLIDVKEISLIPEFISTVTDSTTKIFEPKLELTTLTDIKSSEIPDMSTEGSTSFKEKTEITSGPTESTSFEQNETEFKETSSTAKTTDIASAETTEASFTSLSKITHMEPAETSFIHTIETTSAKATTLQETESDATKTSTKLTTESSLSSTTDFKQDQEETSEDHSTEVLESDDELTTSKSVSLETKSSFDIETTSHEKETAFTEKESISDEKVKATSQPPTTKVRTESTEIEAVKPTESASSETTVTEGTSSTTIKIESPFTADTVKEIQTDAIKELVTPETTTILGAMTTVEEKLPSSISTSSLEDGSKVTSVSTKVISEVPIGTTTLSGEITSKNDEISTPVNIEAETSTSKGETHVETLASAKSTTDQELQTTSHATTEIEDTEKHSPLAVTTDIPTTEASVVSEGVMKSNVTPEIDSMVLSLSTMIAPITSTQEETFTDKKTTVVKTTEEPDKFDIDRKGLKEESTTIKEITIDEALRTTADTTLSPVKDITDSKSSTTVKITTTEEVRDGIEEKTTFTTVSEKTSPEITTTSREPTAGVTFTTISIPVETFKTISTELPKFTGASTTIKLEDVTSSVETTTAIVTEKQSQSVTTDEVPTSSKTLSTDPSTQKVDLLDETVKSSTERVELETTVAETSSKSTTEEVSLDSETTTHIFETVSVSIDKTSTRESEIKQSTEQELPKETKEPATSEIVTETPTFTPSTGFKEPEKSTTLETEAEEFSLSSTQTSMTEEAKLPTTTKTKPEIMLEETTQSPQTKEPEKVTTQEAETEEPQLSTTAIADEVESKFSVTTKTEELTHKSTTLFPETKVTEQQITQETKTEKAAAPTTQEVITEIPTLSTTQITVKEERELTTPKSEEEQPTSDSITPSPTSKEQEPSTKVASTTENIQETSTLRAVSEKNDEEERDDEEGIPFIFGKKLPEALTSPQSSPTTVSLEEKISSSTMEAETTTHTVKPSTITLVSDLSTVAAKEVTTDAKSSAETSEVPFTTTPEAPINTSVTSVIIKKTEQTEKPKEEELSTIEAKESENVTIQHKETTEPLEVKASVTTTTKLDIITEPVSAVTESTSSTATTTTDSVTKTTAEILEAELSTLQDSIETTTAKKAEEITTFMTPTVKKDECLVNGTLYSSGQMIKTVEPCEKCHCATGEVTCFRIFCKLPMKGCVAEILLPDECCPSKYRCPADDGSLSTLSFAETQSTTEKQLTTTPIPISFMFSTTPSAIQSTTLITKSEDEVSTEKEGTTFSEDIFTTLEKGVDPRVKVESSEATEPPTTVSKFTVTTISKPETATGVTETRPISTETTFETESKSTIMSSTEEESVDESSTDSKLTSTTPSENVTGITFESMKAHIDLHEVTSSAEITTGKDENITEASSVTKEILTSTITDKMTTVKYTDMVTTELLSEKVSPTTVPQTVESVNQTVDTSESISEFEAATTSQPTSTPEELKTTIEEQFSTKAAESKETSDKTTDFGDINTSTVTTQAAETTVAEKTTDEAVGEDSSESPLITIDIFTPAKQPKLEETVATTMRLSTTEFTTKEQQLIVSTTKSPELTTEKESEQTNLVMSTTDSTTKNETESVRLETDFDESVETSVRPTTRPEFLTKSTIIPDSTSTTVQISSESSTVSEILSTEMKTQAQDEDLSPSVSIIEEFKKDMKTTKAPFASTTVKPLDSETEEVQTTETEPKQTSKLVTETPSKTTTIEAFTLKEQEKSDKTITEADETTQTLSTFDKSTSSEFELKTTLAKSTSREVDLPTSKDIEHLSTPAVTEITKDQKEIEESSTAVDSEIQKDKEQTEFVTLKTTVSDSLETSPSSEEDAHISTLDSESTTNLEFVTETITSKGIILSLSKEGTTLSVKDIIPETSASTEAELTPITEESRTVQTKPTTTLKAETITDTIFKFVSTRFTDKEKEATLDFAKTTPTIPEESSTFVSKQIMTTKGPSIKALDTEAPLVAVDKETTTREEVSSSEAVTTPKPATIMEKQLTTEETKVELNETVTTQFDHSQDVSQADRTVGLSTRESTEITGTADEQIDSTTKLPITPESTTLLKSTTDEVSVTTTEHKITKEDEEQISSTTKMLTSIETQKPSVQPETTQTDKILVTAEVSSTFSPIETTSKAFSAETTTSGVKEETDLTTLEDKLVEKDAVQPEFTPSVPADIAEDSVKSIDSSESIQTTAVDLKTSTSSQTHSPTTKIEMTEPTTSEAETTKLSDITTTGAKIPRAEFTVPTTVKDEISTTSSVTKTTEIEAETTLPTEKPLLIALGPTKTEVTAEDKTSEVTTKSESTTSEPYTVKVTELPIEKDVKISTEKTDDSETTEKVSKELTKLTSEISSVTPTELSTTASTDISTAAPAEIETLVTGKVSTATPKEVSTDALTDISTNTPTEISIAARSRISTEAPTDISPAEITQTSPESLTKLSTATPTEISSASPTEISSAEPSDKPTTTQSAASVEISTAAATEMSTKVPTEISSAETTQKPTVASTETSTNTISGITTVNVTGIITAKEEAITTESITEKIVTQTELSSKRSTEIPTKAYKAIETTPTSLTTEATTPFATESTTTENATATDAGDDFLLDEGVCFFEGVVYHSAEQIVRSDPCEFCFCFRGDIICLQQSCPPPAPNCQSTMIPGYCCPRYDCPVLVTSRNMTNLTRRKGVQPVYIQRRIEKRAVRTTVEVEGCQIDGKFYSVGSTVTKASGPCLHCKCMKGGNMRCDPKKCKPEAPLMLKMNQHFFKHRET
ncbi:hypothetical protein JTE90_000521 [Oedothorax gibbosus]|uniref:VWFC domain-containing protein n=1 Tax=Oedothorax gibbosus TaxID=931172 RepID=A0AAV6VWE2_9ARAC|nr:hypothetical protein JTE90_000521 [Oedothorax gibbosus]